MVFQDLQADFPQFLAMILEACEHAKRVGNGIATEFRRIRRAGSLLFWRALELEKPTRRRLLIVNRERRAAGDLKQDEGSAYFGVHCLMPEFRACLDDNRGGVFAFHEELRVYPTGCWFGARQLL